MTYDQAIFFLKQLEVAGAPELGLAIRAIEESTQATLAAHRAHDGERQRLLDRNRTEADRLWRLSRELAGAIDVDMLARFSVLRRAVVAFRRRMFATEESPPSKCPFRGNLCVQHGGSPACEDENKRLGMTCPKCQQTEANKGHE